MLANTEAIIKINNVCLLIWIRSNNNTEVIDEELTIIKQLFFQNQNQIHIQWVIRNLLLQLTLSGHLILQEVGSKFKITL